MSSDTNAFRLAEKMYRKAPLDDPSVLDFMHPENLSGVCRRRLDTKQAYTAMQEFLGRAFEMPEELSYYELDAMEGLYIYPQFFPQAIQEGLLLFVDQNLRLSEHNTNLSVNVSQGAKQAADGTGALISQKLRWVTLGYQYNWTDKTYPAQSPGFPEDLFRLVQSLFGINSEAAIVNFYNRGDNLGGHTDHSESCPAPLLSVSIGLEAILLISESKSKTPLAIRLRSGDVVLMSGKSRMAVHGIAQVGGNWPEGLNGGRFDGRRTNINIRQLFEQKSS